MHYHLIPDRFSLPSLIFSLYLEDIYIYINVIKSISGIVLNKGINKSTLTNPLEAEVQFFFFLRNFKMNNNKKSYAFTNIIFVVLFSILLRYRYYVNSALLDIGTKPILKVFLSFPLIWLSYLKTDT